MFFGKTTVHEDLGLFCLFIQRSNLDGGHLNLDGGTLNLNGGMLTLDGGMCPPYNLSRLLLVYETRNRRTLLRKWLVLGCVPSNFMANRRVPKFSLNYCAQSPKKTFMCPKFRTNPVLMYAKRHISTNLSSFLKLCLLYCQKYLPLLQQIADSLKKIGLVGALVLGMLPFSVPCKRKKVRNFLQHFLTTFWQLQMAFLIFEIMAFLFGCSIQCNAIFSSSSAASGAVSSKLDAEVSKVAEKDALRYLKTFFVSFVLKYADKKNSWQSSCVMTFFFKDCTKL